MDTNYGIELFEREDFKAAFNYLFRGVRSKQALNDADEMIMSAYSRSQQDNIILNANMKRVEEQLMGDILPYLMTMIDRCGISSEVVKLNMRSLYDTLLNLSCRNFSVMDKIDTIGAFVHAAGINSYVFLKLKYSRLTRELYEANRNIAFFDEKQGYFYFKLAPHDSPGYVYKFVKNVEGLI